ncbi:MAG: amidohydrolase family protein [Gemmatimonadota bacterium]|nr:MAG: amidohydrolase family protein [Gemmatimonadota bacterium]
MKKRVFRAGIVVLLIGFVVSVSSQIMSGQRERGDVNDDGEVNILDALRTVNIVLGTSPPPSEEDLWAADCDGNGEADVLDALGIVNLILGMGTCVSSCDEVDCDDGNPCTEDYCDSLLVQCRHDLLDPGTPCDDGDPCTENDACADGICQGMPKDCDEGDLCTDDFCDSNTGECSHTPMDCGDGDACTDDSCNPLTGECEHISTFDPCEEGDACMAITNGLLIDGTGAEPIPDAVILIEGEYIKAVGTGSSVEIPTGSEIIDVQGAYILPGFMNTHVHNAYNEDNLQEWARSGVTTVRDLGGVISSPEETFSIRDALLTDNRNARLVAAGPVVTTVGGYGNYPVTSPDDAEEVIHWLIDVGADIIKIAIEDNLQGRTWPLLSMEEITRIVDTAHNRGRLVTAHISRHYQLDMAIQGGVDDVNHMVINYVSDGRIASMIEEDMYWVPTLELWNGSDELHNLNWSAAARDNLQRFVQAGGKVALGTDYSGYVTPFDLGMPITEIRLMVEAEMTPMQIIVAGTKHAAHVCGLEDKLGTIEPCKIADILVVNGNPLDNLESLLDVRLVIHNGEIIREE